MLTDSLGNPVSLQDAASLGAVNDFVEGFISCEARVANILQVAQSDQSPLVQACCAALHMFAESAQGPIHARPYMERARASLKLSPGVTQREQRFVAAVAAWVDGDMTQAIRLHQEQVQEHPRDLASLKLGQYHLFNIGDAPGMLKLALAALPAARDVPYLHGMAAFGWEQCHLLRQAESAARQAIQMCAKEPWAQHALAHVMLTQGRLTEGLSFMQQVSPGWTALNSFMVTHNWWHLAVFALELGQPDEALRLYDQQVWGVVKDYSQDQIGAVSLLARLELAGVDVGERWQDVAQHLSGRLNDQVLPFLDMQYLYGLARAGRSEAQTLMHNIEAFATAAPSPGQADAKRVWQEVCLPASRGLLAHAQGDHETAVRQLSSVLARLPEIGGSHAQRGLFEQVHLDALIRSGRWVGAQHLVQQGLNGHAESARLKRQAQQIYSALGLEFSQVAGLSGRNN
ncbi:MAG: tetratricopeptide repeat protein [Burkholderiales bacterium]|nr:tetratricopeptide repeat protein [Burkholderiales bacterium]